MAYIATQKVAEIRAKLKKEFPEIKFSVRRASHSSLSVSILKSPYDFRPDSLKNDSFMQVNTYWFGSHGYKHVDKLTRIIDICNEGNHNNSRPEIDYFDVGWYFDLSIGKWDKPFELTSH